MRSSIWHNTLPYYEEQAKKKSLFLVISVKGYFHSKSTKAYLHIPNFLILFYLKCGYKHLKREKTIC